MHMLTATSTCEQIQIMTSNLIETGLCNDQKFPFIQKYYNGVEEISVGSSENAVFLKSIPYSEMYEKIIEQRNYNFMMLDGAVISMFYRFKNDDLVYHRLSFFPSPNLESYQNEPDVYLDDEIYADIVDKRIVTVPIRFDFDNAEAVVKPIHHPVSHCTLGQYKQCRIPVSSALTPYQFLMFIIMNFYHTAHEKFSDKFHVFHDCFENSIYDEEKELVYIQCPQYIGR